MNVYEENNDIEPLIDIKEYFYLFRSWAWLIVLVGVLAGGIAYVVSINITPIYEATARLLVSTPSASINGVDPTALVTTQTMTATYSQMVLDTPVLQGVIDQLKLATTTTDLERSISVSVVPNTQLLELSVKDPNPARAVLIANSTAQVFIDRMRQLQSQRYTTSRTGLEKQIADIEQQISTLNTQIASTSDSALLQQLQARLAQYRTIDSNLVATYEQVQLAQEQTSTNVVISAPATTPTQPISPKTAQNTALAVAAGFLLAAGFVFAMDMLDDSIRNPVEIQRKFNVPILGMIAWHESSAEKPIAISQPRSPVTEAFRTIRTNISFAGVDSPIKRILVTSPTPQDGKTTISINLAIVTSQGDKNVLLVDGDLRRPQIHQRFGIMNRKGLTDLFFKTSLENFSDLMYSNGLPKLGVLTSGPLPPNPSELLSSQRMGKIMEQLSRDADMVIVDTPPVLAVTDAAALAPFVDGVVVVVKPGVTKMSALQQSLDQLRSARVRVLGLVLNEVKAGSRKYGYYYHRYYSKYSYGYRADGVKQNMSRSTGGVDLIRRENGVEKVIPSLKIKK